MIRGESPEVPEVDPTDALVSVSSSDAVIIDVRELNELRQASVSGAVHIPMGELTGRLEEVPQDKNVYVLCHSGQRSAMVTAFLGELGHTSVWNIRGGIVAWHRAGLPIQFGNE